MAAATLLTLITLVTFSDYTTAFERPSSPRYGNHSSNATCSRSSTSLADLALGKVLSDAAPVFGDYADVQSNTSTWYGIACDGHMNSLILTLCRMKAYRDDTPIVHMNLPGTHDADTWNYRSAMSTA